MEVKPLPIYYSRSAVAQDWSCQRKRYWGYEYQGRGLSSATTPLALYFGILLHDGLAAIVQGVPIDDICKAAVEQFRFHLLEDKQFDQEAVDFADEQCALGEGLLRAFDKHAWPMLMSQYEVVASEQEMLYEHDGLTFMAKPDLLLRHRESGDMVYVEFKSTSSIKEQWMTSWQTAIQLHSSIKAVEATLGETIQQVMVIGLYKSYMSNYGRQESIFCHGYHKPGQPPMVKEQWSYIYRAGLKKSPIWKKEGGVKKWVEEMPENLLSQQLPMTPPIFVNRDLIESFFRQRGIREHDIRTARKQIADPNLSDYEKQQWLDTIFIQNFEACSPGWGTGCDFKKLCHGYVQDPLLAGFQLRHSHHQVEEGQLNAEM